MREKALSNDARGYLNGIVAGMSFGLIPLFSIPVLAAGVGDVSTLVYRFFFGSLFMLLMLLGLLPTALSNICVTRALRLIDSTVVALLGAMEPVTAMFIGICVLGDPFSMMNISGAALILIAVAILTLRK